MDTTLPFLRYFARFHPAMHNFGQIMAGKYISDLGVSIWMIFVKSGVTFLLKMAPKRPKKAPFWEPFLIFGSNSSFFGFF